MENIKHNFKTQAKTNGNPQSPSRYLSQIAGKLINVGESRIKEMNQAGIDVQVLSLFSPGVRATRRILAVKIAKETNDYIADKILQYPTRFTGFTTLPTPVPETAADELERSG